MEDPFKYVQDQQTEQPPANVPADDEPPRAPISTLQQQARYKHIALLAIIGIFVVIALIGFYFILLRDDPAPQPTPQEPTQSSTEQQPQTSTITQETESYNSAGFFLSFEHPVDWTVEEDRSDGVLTVVSDQLTLPGATTQTQGIVQMTIRKPSAELPEFENGNAVAALPSQKITYTNPSSAQRGDTYVSYLTFAGSAAGLIDGVYITGDFGYKQDQAIPKVDIEKIDPIVSVRFYACDGQCSQTVGVGRDFPDTEVGKAVITMLKSLRIS